MKYNFFSDVRFWILVFFVIRLIGITNPPLEVAHNWRQTTVTMVARNFYETDSNIFYPRIDFAGEKTGITGMEFPFLNYLIYLISLVFGYTHWYGRLINLFVSSVGAFYFYKIVRMFFEEKIALYSSIILSTSIWFSYSRKIMPDTFSMSLVIIGFYYGINFLRNNFQNIKSILLYVVFMLLGIASKLPSGFVLILFLPFLFDSKISLKHKIIFSAGTFIFLLSVAFWYLYWVPYLVEKFGFWHFFMGKSLLQGTKEILVDLNLTAAHFYENAIKFIGFAVFIFGLIYAIIKKDKLILSIFLFGFLAFVPVMFKSGTTFVHHPYYIVPFVPLMALIAGYGLCKMKNKKLIVVLLVAICMENILDQQHDFFLKKNARPFNNLEYKLDKYSFRKDLIVVNSGDYPTPIYFAHRRGWIASNDDLQKTEFVNAIKFKGCKFIVILKRYLGTEVVLNYQQIYNDEDFTIYKL